MAKSIAKEIAKDGSGIVRLIWAEAEMKVAARSEDKGMVEATVPVRAEGGAGRVALNVSYLLDYLQDKEGLVTMGVTAEKSPIQFHHGGSPLVVIMPMSVEW